MASSAYAGFNTYHQQYISANVGIPYASTLYRGSTKVHGFRGVGGTLYLGEEFNHTFGPELELQYDDYGAKGQYLLFGISGRATYNFNQQVNVFVKAGLGSGEVRVSNQGAWKKRNMMVPVFGGGLGVALTPKWLTTVEFNGSYFSEDSSSIASGVLGVLTLGITRFFNC